MQITVEHEAPPSPTHPGKNGSHALNLADCFPERDIAPAGSQDKIHPDEMGVIALAPSSPYKSGMDGAVELSHDDCFKDQKHMEPLSLHDPPKPQGVVPEEMGVLSVSPPSPYNRGMDGAVELHHEDCFQGRTDSSLSGVHPEEMGVLELAPSSPYNTGKEGAVELAHEECFDL